MSNSSRAKLVVYQELLLLLFLLLLVRSHQVSSGKSNFLVLHTAPHQLSGKSFWFQGRRPQRGLSRMLQVVFSKEVSTPESIH